MKRHLICLLFAWFCCANVSAAPAMVLPNDRCYAEQPNFCECMQRHFAAECPQCRIANIINTVKNQIENVCHGKALIYKNIDVDNCIEDLHCFITGTTINSAHACLHACTY